MTIGSKAQSHRFGVVASSEVPARRDEKTENMLAYPSRSSGRPYALRRMRAALEPGQARHCAFDVIGRSLPNGSR